MADTLTEISAKRLAVAIEHEVGYGLSLIERGLEVLRQVEPHAKALEGFDAALLRTKCAEFDQAVKVVRGLASDAPRSLQKPKPPIQSNVDQGHLAEVIAARGES